MRRRCRSTLSWSTGLKTGVSLREPNVRPAVVRPVVGAVREVCCVVREVGRVVEAVRAPVITPVIGPVRIGPVGAAAGPCGPPGAAGVPPDGVPAGASPGLPPAPGFGG